MREMLLVLGIIGLCSTILYDKKVIEPRIAESRASQVEKAQDRFDDLKEKNKELEKEVSELKKSVAAAHVIVPKVVAETKPVQKEVVIEEGEPLVIPKDNSYEILQLEKKIKTVEASSDDKQRQLEQSRRTYENDLVRIRKVKGNFKEQSVNGRGRSSGIRTSDADRAIFEQKRDVALANTNNQISAVNSQIAITRNEEDLLINAIRDQIKGLRQ